MENKTLAVLDPYHEDAIALLKSTAGLNVILPKDPERQSWHGSADGVLVRSITRLTAEDFSLAAPRLKVVAKQGVGVDNIDLEAASKFGVMVYNTPGLNAESVAELSLAMALSLSRRITEIDRKIRSGGEAVDRTKMLGLSLFKKTVGVVGMGNIGKIAAEKWIGCCSSNLITYDPAAPADAWASEGIPHTRVGSLEEVLRVADVVTIHVPLLPTTRGMIGAKELSLMKDNSILINTARGGLVDENALLAELKGGRLWGAVLDALEAEPPTREAYSEFLALGNVILTPHIGASTTEMQSLSGCTAARVVANVLKGEEVSVGKLV